MARKTIKTMADKMAEAGKSIGKNVLDDADLATDPIISALQTLRLTIDDMQYNDTNHGTDKQTSLISANTAKTGITDTQAKAITANTAKTGISEVQVGLLKALGKGLTLKDLTLTISKDKDNNLVIQDGKHTWKIAAQDK
tara:strand:- start:521 stop:940 length:420 start_codon:yes stop_codon:yes gene_type:complete